VNVRTEDTRRCWSKSLWFSSGVVLLASLSALSMSGCATTEPTQRENPFATLHLKPIPSSATDRDSECLLLSQEIVRQGNLAQFAGMNQPPMFALTIRALSQQNIAYIQSRRAQIQCDSVRLVVDPPGKTSSEKEQMSLEMCVKKCAELTARNPEQCFDACK
jgi:hypothetical protein